MWIAGQIKTLRIFWISASIIVHWSFPISFSLISGWGGDFISYHIISCEFQEKKYFEFQLQSLPTADQSPFSFSVISQWGRHFISYIISFHIMSFHANCRKGNKNSNILNFSFNRCPLIKVHFHFHWSLNEGGIAANINAKVSLVWNNCK